MTAKLGHLIARRVVPLLARAKWQRLLLSKQFPHYQRISDLMSGVESVCHIRAQPKNLASIAQKKLSSHMRRERLASVVVCRVLGLCHHFCGTVGERPVAAIGSVLLGGGHVKLLSVIRAGLAGTKGAVEVSSGQPSNLSLGSRTGLIERL